MQEPHSALDLWSRRTHEVLDICGKAMHETPLAKLFKNAKEFPEHYPTCELPIHDVRYEKSNLSLSHIFRSVITLPTTLSFYKYTLALIAALLTAYTILQNV